MNCMSDELKCFRIGLIVNPIAGIGGKVGLKGSDLPDVMERAIALGGGELQAPLRVISALKHLLPLKTKLEWVTYAGDMGENELAELGFVNINVIGQPQGQRSKAVDTIEAARKIKQAGVECLVFAGGDGTARNIFEAVGETLPVIGIPAGVKIHSAVYAINPQNAGQAIVDLVEGRVKVFKMAEVMDINEDLFRQGQVNARLYGYMNTPEIVGRMQNMKSGGYSEEDSLIGAAGFVVCQMEEDVLYIIGPGSTTRHIMEDLGIQNTLLGVDVVKNGQLVANDVTEAQLWALVSQANKKVKIVLTIIGGQGNLLGRGNQQISPRIIKAVGKENIIVLASTAKLIALNKRPLSVDTGDSELDTELSGFVEIVVGFGQSTYYKVGG